MERWEEKNVELQNKIEGLTVAVRAVTADVNKLVGKSRAHEKKLRALEKSKYRVENRREALGDVMKILVRLTALHSKRLDQLVA